MENQAPREIGKEKYYSLSSSICAGRESGTRTWSQKEAGSCGAQRGFIYAAELTVQEL